MKQISGHIEYMKAEPISPSHMLSTGNISDPYWQEQWLGGQFPGQLFSHQALIALSPAQAPAIITH